MSRGSLRYPEQRRGVKARPTYGDALILPGLKARPSYGDTLILPGLKARPTYGDALILPGLKARPTYGGGHRPRHALRTWAAPFRLRPATADPP